MRDHIAFRGRLHWGFDAIDSPPIMNDPNGHGTYVAGNVPFASLPHLLTLYIC